MKWGPCGANCAPPTYVGKIGTRRSTVRTVLVWYSYSGSASDREFAIGIGIRRVAASGRLRHPACCGIEC